MQTVLQPSPPVQVAPDGLKASTTRNVAVDVYRGFVMLLMMAEVLHFNRVAQAFPGNGFWSALAYQQSHVAWTGCSLHDLIQPSFSFLVGVALPYSLASRLAKGISPSHLFGQAVWRSLVLVALGIFLRSVHSPQTNFTFEDTLTQIGLGYPFLFLLGLRPPRWQWTALGIILAGYWLAWALYPAPDPSYSALGVPADWPHKLTGFASHWNKNSNFGSAFDYWFLNLFPRSKPFVANGGGYLTLSFIPTMGTMLLGLAAGRWLKAAAPRIPFRQLLTAGLLGVAAGLLLHMTGLCPIVKRVWTPSWTLFSGGLCFFLLAAFSWVIDLKGYRKFAFPLLVIGMNSMAAYLLAHLLDSFIVGSFRIHLGQNVFQMFGTALEPLLQGATLLLVYWLLLFWMYRRNLFLRV